jgi:hypothetical protein
METMMRLIFYILISSCLLAAGCRDSNEAIEGKVKISSTKVFSNNKAMKSPPPQVPTQ